MASDLPDLQLTATRIERTPPRAFSGGRYVVERMLGEGGQKIVFLAHDTALDRSCAVALLKGERQDASGADRVSREARAMARLGAQPNIVAVFDIGDDEGRPFIVCEYVPGGDLREELRRAAGPLPIERALAIGVDVARGMAFAHSRGIVHRDLKPANIWLAEDRSAKLGDFGLAAARDRSLLTAEGTIIGTAAYMSPEQALGTPADERSDLYSLGAVLYELLTGRPPFIGDEAVSVISQHINTAPVAPSWHNSNVPRPLESLVMRLLAKSPDERGEGAAAVCERLAAIAASMGGLPDIATADEANPLDRLAGGVFVGREREVEALRATFDAALSGRGRLMLLAGEPGIGKTRIADELCVYARLRGAQVLVGRCYEGEGAPAYWPWVRAIRSYAATRDVRELLSEMGPGVADIAQVVSDLRTQIPNVPMLPLMEPEQARFRLFDSITTFLKNASTSRPLVLVLDDLHWADKPSLLLLQFLARELANMRVLVIGTYRDVELGRKHPLAQSLGELLHDDVCDRVLLRGLSHDDVAHFIEMMAGNEPSATLVSAVFRETEGNPFFVNEVVRLLVAEGRLERTDGDSMTVTIPQGVREVIGRRLDYLSEECNRVLTVASVIGREFDMEALARVSNLDADALLDLLDEAVSARVISDLGRVDDAGRRGAVGRYAFSHALIRETLYDELPTVRRVRAHRQVGEALEAIHGERLDAHLAELAHHFLEAARGSGAVDKAIDYAMRAARRASAQCAYEEALAHYERALEAVELFESPDRHRRCELLLAAGQEKWKCGDYAGSKETCGQAADLAAELGDGELLARAALGRGGSFAGFDVGVRDESLGQLYRRTLDTLPPGDHALRALVLARLAGLEAFGDQPDVRFAMADEAIAMARRIADPVALAEVLAEAQWALATPENAALRAGYAREVAQIAEQEGDRALQMGAMIWGILCLMELGDVGAADQMFPEAQRIADELRRPYDSWTIAVLDAMRALMNGRLVEAEGLIHRAFAIGQSGAHQNAAQLFGAQLIELRREQGRIGEIETIVKSFPVASPHISAASAAVAWFYREMDDVEAAAAQLEAIAAGGLDRIGRDPFWLTTMGLLVEVCAFVRNTDRAQELYALLQPVDGLTIFVPLSVSLGPVSRYLGLLATTLGRWDDAARHFDDALATTERVGARPWHAHTQQDYARMLLARGSDGDRGRAEALLNEAEAAAQEMGLVRLQTKIADARTLA